MLTIKNPIHYGGECWKLYNSGVYVNHEVFCHLAHTEHPRRQIGVFLPVEAVYRFSCPELLKLIAESTRDDDELHIDWPVLEKAGYSPDAVQHAINEGIEARIFRRSYHGPLKGGPRLFLNTRGAPFPLD